VGVKNSWHSRVNCDHGDSITSRFGLTCVAAAAASTAATATPRAGDLQNKNSANTRAAEGGVKVLEPAATAATIHHQIVPTTKETLATVPYEQSQL
jgi:hypothetical protein